MTERQYWDTCTWIDLVNDGGTPDMKALWSRVELGSIEVLFSAVTITECLFRAEGEVRPFTDPHASDALFDAPNTYLVQLDRNVAELSRTLRRRYNLGAPDAIHLAAAIHWNADVLITSDKGVLNKLPPQTRRDGMPLKIATPADVVQGPLFAGRYDDEALF